MSAQDHSLPSVASQSVTRRDFLYVATAAFAGAGSVIAVRPFLNQMNPAADVVAAGAPIDVDLTPIEPGQQIVVMWRGAPVFVVRRTAAMLATLTVPTHLSRLRDPNSAQLQQPDYAENWSRSLKPEFLVIVGICTHLGCIPQYTPELGHVAGVDDARDGGYFCHCHGSKYDSAGRVFKNVPAPFNLPVPPHSFIDDATLRIGENPPGSDFELSSIKQP